MRINKRRKAAKIRENTKKLLKCVSHNAPQIFDDIPWEDEAMPQIAEDCVVEGPQNVPTVDNEVMEIENFLQNVPNWCLKKYEAKDILTQKNKKFGVLSHDEYVDILNHDLEKEVVAKPVSPIDGNRIVELGYFLECVLKLQYDHCRKCTLGKLLVKSEDGRGKGLVRRIVLTCEQCAQEFEVFTENPNKTVSTINTGIVWGTMATGSTYTHLEELLSCVEVPPMPSELFYAKEKELGEVWKQSLWNSMNEAGIEEKQYAIANNSFTIDGIPSVTVYVDGSWSKRSYGTNYNSLSGMVGIIGRHTGKLLFIAVRNKFCSICCRSDNKSEKPKEHLCYKNWSDSAPAMESDMVVQGFNCSEEMHGIRYTKFIADGDSSVFAKIKEKVYYGHQVKKLECTNHAIENYSKHLLKIKADMQINKDGRKLLTKDKILKLVKRAKCSIYEHAKNEQNVTLLKEDLRNGLHHVFGDHEFCREGICNNIGDQSSNRVPELKAKMIYDHLCGALNLLVRKANLLIENENNNRAERLMNVVARFNMGKRLNLIQRGSYERRVYLAGLRYNRSFSWHTSPWKRTLGHSPGSHLKRFMYKHQQKQNCRKKLFADTNQKKQIAKPQLKTNIDYGKKAEQPPEDEEIIQEESKKLIEQLQIVSEDKRNEIESLSKGQFSNTYYEYERKYRLTASLFGSVVKRKPYTPCHNIVKACLKKNTFLTEAMQYGIAKENVAIELFRKEMIKNGKILNVDSSGLWIDLEHGFLGASPDGVVKEEDAIIEVKCLYAAAKAEVTSILEAIEKKKAPYLEKWQCNETCSTGTNEMNSKLISTQARLKRNHNYYYQVQGQLNITGKQKCYFIVYISDSVDIFYEEIQKDETFWRTLMLPKLITFYTDCIAPEIIRDQLGKGKRCIDPPFILDEIQKHNGKKNDVKDTTK